MNHEAIRQLKVMVRDYDVHHDYTGFSIKCIGDSEYHEFLAKNCEQIQHLSEYLELLEDALIFCNQRKNEMLDNLYKDAPLSHRDKLWNYQDGRLTRAWLYQAVMSFFGKASLTVNGWQITPTLSSADMQLMSAVIADLFTIEQQITSTNDEDVPTGMKASTLGFNVAEHFQHLAQHLPAYLADYREKNGKVKFVEIPGMDQRVMIGVQSVFFTN